jgi:hypothetical protein
MQPNQSAYRLHMRQDKETYLAPFSAFDMLMLWT